jgi:hypothetical protein
VCKYRIVKWSPEEPAKKQPATEAVYTDPDFAERIKTALEKVLPHRCFAVEVTTEVTKPSNGNGCDGR